MPSQPTSVGEWLKIAVTRIYAVSGSPQLDAEILLHAVAGIHRALAYARPEQVLTAEQVESLEPALARRARGEPIAYIVGTQEFWSMRLEVSPAVLIPRPETELLVERALAHVPLNDISRVLDLGTGSGAIALAIAHARAHAQVVAVDISAEALAVAATNRDALGIENIQLQRSDWFEDLGGERFDVIVSNPPYVAADDPHLAPDVARFEPHVALFAGPTGLDAIRRIVEDGKRHLQPGGWLLLEHGWQQGAAVRSLLARQGYLHVGSRPDLAGHERVTEGRWPAAGKW
jgi:release factor glutamine methyltransferase